MLSITSIRVRFEDTDTMSVVYYGNYLTYFAVAWVEYLRERGLPISEVNKRIHMPVVEALVRYVKPARLDDLLEVTSRVSERKRASFTFSYEIKNEAREIVATGHTRHVCLDAATTKMIALPDWLKEHRRRARLRGRRGAPLEDSITARTLTRFPIFGRSLLAFRFDETRSNLREPTRTRPSPRSRK